MKQLKILMFILLAITIGSCYSIEPDCNDVSIPIDPGPIDPGPIDPDPLPDEGFYWESIRGSSVLIASVIQSRAIANNGNIWVGCRGKVYLSADNGNTWIEKSNGLPQQSSVNTIAINPINGYLFAGTQSGMFRSTDQGESWKMVMNGLMYMDIGHILITTSGEIYFVALGNTYYSNDNGDTWIQKSNTLPYDTFGFYPLTLGGDGILYVGTKQGVYRSTNGGDTWLPPSNHTNIRVNDITISDDGSIFAVDGSTLVFSGTNTGVLKSTDRGITWNLCNTGITNEVGVSAIMYNPVTKDIFVSNNYYTHAIYRSTDLGENWELSSTYSLGTSGFAFNPNTGQMYALTDAALYILKNYP